MSQAVKLLSDVYFSIVIFTNECSLLDLLVKRCARRDTRPLLRDGDPREILAGLMDERYPIYKQADITVETDDGPHTDTVDRIISALEAHKSERAPL